MDLQLDVSRSTTNVHATAALSPASHHIDALDGVRGIAILMVLLYHFGVEAVKVLNIDTWLYRPCDLGWLGVDLFFVLSGLLITGILHDSRHRAHYFRDFYFRRTLRIFPLYFGTLAVAFGLAACVPAVAGWLGRAYSSQLWFWLYGTNILAALHGWSGPIDHFWTLAVEEHFYLVWPVVIYLLPRRAAMGACLVAVGIAIATRALVVHSTYGVVAVYVLTPARVDSLAIGGLLALALRAGGTGDKGGAGVSAAQWKRRAHWTMAGCAVLLLVLYLTDRRMHEYYTLFRIYGYTLSAVFFAAVLTLAVVSQGWEKRVFSWSPLRTLGKLSYGIYVLHPFLEPFRTATFPKLVPAWLTRFPSLLFCFYVVYGTAGCVLAAALSWHLYEKHFLKLKRYFGGAKATRYEGTDDPARVIAGQGRVGPPPSPGHATASA
jgi:peptidoglycan/LPS O-acetylase OafA/YrhL